MVRNFYIIGAGISGLATAYELLKRGEKVTVFEASSEVGGLARTSFWNDDYIDMGPHIYHTPDEDIKLYLLDEFGSVLHERHHWSKNLIDGKFYDYPISYDLIDSLNPKIKDKILLELKNSDPEKAKSATNFYDYMMALAGKTLQSLFFQRYPEKLWGMSTKQIDANWAPKRIVIRDKSTPFYFGQWSAIGKNGSGSVLDLLEQKINKYGVQIRKNEPVQNMNFEGNNIYEINTNKEKITLQNNDVVINTLSATNISRILNFSNNLSYRGVILVFIKVNKNRLFENDIDFIYIDDPKISFNRISDQNSFLKKGNPKSTIACCEITYSPGDGFDMLEDDALSKIVKDDLLKVGLVGQDNILDSKVIRLPEVYPMFKVGYKKDLNEYLNNIGKYNNLFNIGSLAEFAYADLQILFSKAIDLAYILSSKTMMLNGLHKKNQRLNFEKSLIINNREIKNNSSAYIIAEIGLNHNGSLKLARELIDKAIEAKVDAVKFQTYSASSRVSKNSKTARYAEKVLGIEETDYEMFLKYELSEKDLKSIFEYAKDKITIFSAPFDERSVDILEKLNTPCYKIASFDATNLRLLKAVARTKKPIILSTGMMNISDIQNSLQTIINEGNNKVAILHCCSVYPCPASEMNIKAIDTIRNSFNGIPTGLSDHYPNNEVSYAAVARGSSIIEKHFTLDRNMEGPDHTLSLNPKELKEFVETIRVIESSIGDGIKQASNSEQRTSLRFMKTMYTSRVIECGERISQEMIVYKGPGFGLLQSYENFILGKKVNKRIEEDYPITWEDIE